MEILVDPDPQLDSAVSEAVLNGLVGRRLLVHDASGLFLTAGPSDEVEVEQELVQLALGALDYVGGCGEVRGSAEFAFKDDKAVPMRLGRR